MRSEVILKFRVLPFLLAAAVVSAQTPDEAARESIIRTALSFKGVPYVYGAASPSAFDCSGFVNYVYRQAVGLVIPRTSKTLYAAGAPVRPEKAKPGDVLVFDTVGGAPSHVAIVLDDQSMIHAASQGPRTGVIVSPLGDKYFAPRVIGARSFLPGEDDAAPSAKPGTKPVAPPPPKPAAPSAEKPTRPVAGKPSAPGVAPSRPARIPDKNETREEPVISLVGFSITDEPVIFTDKIPAAVGTAVQFAVKNETGRDGVFEILFYLMDKDPSKAKTIRRDRIRIRAGGMTETEPIRFDGPGQYKLILKTHDNLKRVERIWKVVAVK